MKRAPNALIEIYRIKTGMMGTTVAACNNGAFRIPYRQVMLQVIASDGDFWDHVSVSLPDRCPTWEEMCHVKDLFFKTDEWVVQYHPAKSAYVNNHPFCLHLWRPQHVTIPLPPSWMVGDAKFTDEQMKNMTHEQRRQVAENLAKKHGINK